jgi:hypothetical protein
MLGSKEPLTVLDYPGGKRGGMTANHYQKQVLNGKFFSYFQRMSEECSYVVFQQDNTCCHIAQSTMS